MVRLVVLTGGDSELLLDLSQHCPAVSRFFLTPDSTVSLMPIKTEGPINIHSATITSPTTVIITT